MVSTTSTYNLQIPTVGSDEDAWGGYVNATITAVGNLLDGTTPVTGIDINSGAIDGTAIGANSASTGAFTTVVGTTLNLSTGLAANLSTNGFDLVTTSNANLDLAPHGTGKVVIRGNTNSAKIILNCENNSHGVTVSSPPHSASATYEVALPNALGLTNASAVVTSDANGVVGFDNGTTEESTVVTSSSNAATINLRDGNVFTHTLSENVTYTFSNPAASGRASAFILKVVQDSSARTITWPGTVDWAAATAPTITATNAGVDVFAFITVDGGTNYYGFTLGQAMG
jgi:predicted secreted protein